MVGVVVAADAKAKELAGGALDLLPLGLQRALQQPVARLKVPVVPPQQMDAADRQEVGGRQPLQEGLKLIWRTQEIHWKSTLTTVCVYLGMIDIPRQVHYLFRQKCQGTDSLEEAEKKTTM